MRGAASPHRWFPLATVEASVSLGKFMRNWLRLPPPLRLAIPALVLVFNVCFVAVTAWTIIGRDRDREIERMRHQSAQQVAALATSAGRLPAGSIHDLARFLEDELSVANADE